MKNIVIKLGLIIILLLISGCNRAAHVSCWSSISNVVHNQGSYFITTYDEHIITFDPKTQELDELCQDETCSHNNNRCNAHIDYLITSPIDCYKGEVYVLGRSQENELILYKYDKNKQKQEIMMLEKLDKDINFYCNFSIYGDYVYYSLAQWQDEEEMVNPKLYRKKLAGDEEAQFVFCNEMKEIQNSDISRVQAYNGKLYFINDYNDSSGENKGDIYEYNPKSQQLNHLVDDIYGEFFILENELYYQNNNEPIMKLNLKTKEKSIFSEYDTENPYLYISSDGNYIYTDNWFSCYLNHKDYTSRAIKVYDLSGVLKQIIDLGGNSQYCLFGDENELVLETDKGIALYDKKQIGSAENEWSELILY